MYWEIQQIYLPLNDGRAASVDGRYPGVSAAAPSPSEALLSVQCSVMILQIYDQVIKRSLRRAPPPPPATRASPTLSSCRTPSPCSCSTTTTTVQCHQQWQPESGAKRHTSESSGIEVHQPDSLVDCVFRFQLLKHLCIPLIFTIGKIFCYLFLPGLAKDMIIQKEIENCQIIFHSI